MLKNIIFPLLILVLACGRPDPGSTLQFDTQGAEAMLEVIQAIHDREDRETVATLLDEALTLEGYQVSNQRYTSPRRSEGNRVSLPQFRRFLLSYLEDEVDTQDNRRLNIQKAFYQDAIDQPEKYRQALEVFHAIPADRYQQSLERALHWLPEDPGLAVRVWVLFDIGGSGGWEFETEDGRRHMGFDLTKMVDEEGHLDGEMFLATVAHEMHHAGLPLRGYYESIDAATLSDTSRLGLYTTFLESIIKEGAAQKFCSNATGKLSRRVYPDESFAIMAAARVNWDYFMSELTNIHGHAVRQLRGILEGEITDADQIRSDLNQYWSWRAGELEGKTFMLGRRYYYGAELLGVIHEALGREAVFEAFGDLRRIPALYNEGLRKLEPGDYEQVLFPEDLVRMAGEL
jgi:hypothetical protein